MIEVFKRDEVINNENYHSEIDMKNFPAGITFTYQLWRSFENREDYKVLRISYLKA